ncbi:MAG: CIA30 family protein [Bacteroidetes bacterium]|nr:CIA30 family protein [Bacteroidota bacterium]
MRTMTIFDFTLPESTESWQPVDDVVMGGVSESRMVHDSDGHAVFAGTLSRENNGGFASIRCAPKQLELGDFDGIRLRVCGDGKIYRLRLRMDGGFDGLAYQESFPTEDGVWSTVDIPFTDFRPSFRGRDVPNAPALDPGSIRQIGLMIADVQQGAFRLEIALIAAIASAGSICRRSADRDRSIR